MCNWPILCSCEAALFSFRANDDKCDFHGNKSENTIYSFQQETGRFIIMDRFSSTSVFITNPQPSLTPTLPPPSPAQLAPLSPPADGGELPPSVEQRSGQLVFTKVTRSDAGDYMCVASNSLQGEIRAVVTLTVAGESHYPPGAGPPWKERLASRPPPTPPSFPL